MIKSFKHKGLERFFHFGKTSGIIHEHKRKLQLILTALNQATEPRDMNLPGVNLHPLHGIKKDYWSVKVSKNWRIIFRFKNKNIMDVDYIDYH